MLEGTNNSWTKSLQVIENIVIFLPMTIAQWILNNFSLAGSFYSKLTAVYLVRQQMEYKRLFSGNNDCLLKAFVPG